MPLTELMNYFNDQLQTQARLHELPKTGFYKADNQYWARFGNLILGSQFAEILSAKDDHLIGHYADLFVRSSTGNVLNIDHIVNALEDKEQVVHLDRLVRTLHSLNYLQQHDGFKGLLALRVQSRHILSVANDHGKTFEKILGDCGLGPERVVLHTKLVDARSLEHFQQALTSYRERQYRIGISLHNIPDWELLRLFDLQPDYIFSGPILLQQFIDQPVYSLGSTRILVAATPDVNQYKSALLLGDDSGFEAYVRLPGGYTQQSFNDTDLPADDSRLLAS
jgi:EAL domain-containing protein (putative c-di-GMP-specific phosphodiesterase class I)